MKKLKHPSKVRSRWLSATVLALLSSSMLHVMAAQVNTFYVTDSETEIAVRTFSDDAWDACALAGYEEEAYALVADDTDRQGARRLTVEKRFPAVLTVDGETTLEATHRQTVRAFLAENNVTLGPYDEVQPAPETVLAQQATPQQIRVVRVNKRLETAQVTLPYETSKRHSDALDYGQTRVVQAGANGVAEQTIEVVLHDGQEVSRTVVEETVLTPAQTELIEVGTGGAVVTRGGDVLRYRQVLDVKATAYSTEGWSRENQFTAIGTRCRVGAVAVDPKVIPLGSRLYITSPDGKAWIYGTAVAEDTGGYIKGNRIDLYFNTQAECERFGVQGAKVYVLA